MSRALLPVPSDSTSTVAEQEPDARRYPIAKLLFATAVLALAIGAVAVSLSVAAALTYVNVWAPIAQYLSMAGVAFIAGLGAAWWLLEH